ncbi:MAG: glycosyltransferase family 4 protein [Candidatus Bathyarchaeia archaeon]
MSQTRSTRVLNGKRYSRKVLLVVDNAPARIERIHKVVKTLETQGYVVNVAYPRGLETLSEYGTVPIVSVGRPPLLHYLVFTLFLFLNLVSNPPDIVHFVSLPDVAVLGIVLARKLRHFRFVYDRRAAFSVIVEHYHKRLGFLARAVENLAFNNADAILVVVPAFERELAAFKRKLLFVPNGVSLAEFRPRKVRKRGALTVLVVAALTYVEGIDVFIKAARLVRDSEPHARFVVVGDGESARELQRLNVALQRPVQFAGWVPFERVPLEINGADICVSCVLPTIFTDYAYPVKLFEYLACRKPVIVSNIRGHTELVRDEKDGLVYDANSPPDLSRKIIRLIKNRNLRRSLAANGYNLAKRYSWETCSAALIRGYERILT